jgi:hypothetical protein
MAAFAVIQEEFSCNSTPSLGLSDSLVLALLLRSKIAGEIRTEASNDVRSSCTDRWEHPYISFSVVEMSGSLATVP